MAGSNFPSDRPAGLEGRPHRRRWLRWIVIRLSAVILGLLGVVAAIEGSFRLVPGLYPGNIQNWAFAKYDTLPGGMYVKDKTTRMRFMRADFSTRAFSHGYFWRHRTDRLGFRNPAGLPAPEVLLLGDSFIYGHGVEEDQTVGHFLRADHGIAAYNMASQGQCLYEHTVLLNLYLDQFEAKTVVLFAFLNDFRDLENKRSRRLIERIPEIRQYDYDEIRADVDQLKAEKKPLIVRALFELGTVRMATKWFHKSGESEGGKPDASPKTLNPAVVEQRRSNGANNQSPVETPASESSARPVESTRPMNYQELKSIGLWPGRVEVPILDPYRLTPIARYYRRVLASLGDRCRRRETRLVLIHLVVPSRTRGDLHLQAQRKMRRLLARIADENDIEFFDTEGLFEASESNFLPGDGHLSPNGHRRLAEFIAEDVVPAGDKPQE